MTSNLIGLGLVWRNKVPRANKECPLTIFVLLFPGSLREENTWRFAAVLVLARVPVRAVIKYYMTSSHLAQPNPHPSLPLSPPPSPSPTGDPASEEGHFTPPFCSVPPGPCLPIAISVSITLITL